MSEEAHLRKLVTVLRPTVQVYVPLLYIDVTVQVSRVGNINTVSTASTVASVRHSGWDTISPCHNPHC